MSEITEQAISKDATTTNAGASDSPQKAGPDRSLWTNVCAVTLGFAASVLGLTVLQGYLWPQMVTIGAGLVSIYSGLARLGTRRFGRSFDLTAWLCAIWLVFLVVVAALAPLLPLGEHEDIAKTLTAQPLLRPDLLSAHPLGTNSFGLDIFARIIYGARASLVVSILAVAIGMTVGGTVGILAGYLRRTTDTVIGILTNSLLAIPPLILLIALAALLEPSLRNIAVALSILALPSMIRMARASTLAFSQREFVLAAKSMGASKVRVMARELLPNVVLPLVSYGMVMVSVLIVAESSLSFLGLGIQPPSPSWGNMIAEGEGNAFAKNPHIVIVPGLVLFLTVFSFNLLGERARNRWDPRQTKI